METTEKKTWTLDKSHSSVHFSVKHMVVSQTKGSYENYSLKVETSGLDFENAKIELEIDANSITTGMPDRDNHLRSADFFDVLKFPVIKFVSSEMKKINEEEYLLAGDFTIKGITKKINFNVNYGGQVIDPWGNIRAGFNLEAAIDRFDFGLTWNSLIEAGGAVVGKTVKLSAEIEITTAK